MTGLSPGDGWTAGLIDGLTDEWVDGWTMGKWMDGWWVDEWMDGWMMGRWMGGWMDRWMDGWMMGRWMDGWMDDGQMDGWMDDGQMDGWMDDGQMDGWMDDEQMDGWMDDGQMDGWMDDGQMDGWMDDGRMDGWMDDGQMDGWMDGVVLQVGVLHVVETPLGRKENKCLIIRCRRDNRPRPPRIDVEGQSVHLSRSLYFQSLTARIWRLYELRARSGEVSNAWKTCRAVCELNNNFHF